MALCSPDPQKDPAPEGSAHGSLHPWQGVPSKSSFPLEAEPGVLAASSQSLHLGREIHHCRGFNPTGLLDMWAEEQTDRPD